MKIRPGYIHSSVYDFAFESYYSNKLPAYKVGSLGDCDKKYSYDGFGGKDSVLFKEYAQCVVGYNKGSSLPQTVAHFAMLNNLPLLFYDSHSRIPGCRHILCDDLRYMVEFSIFQFLGGS